MKEQLITLPQELHALIISYVGAKWPPARYLRSCALVSKKWLHEARRQYFLNSSTLEVYTGGNPDRRHFNARHDRSNKILRDFFYQDEPICTFWPYIRDIEVSAHYPGTPDEFISLLSLCLARASDLRTLRVDGMKYLNSLRDIIPNLAATNTITSIHIERCSFPAPEDLDVFLGLFPQLSVECQLKGNEFECTEWDGSLSYVFSPSPSLQFSIDAWVREDFDLEVFLHHQWNITNLHIEPINAYQGRMDFHLLTDAMKQIGASLKSLSLELHNLHFRGPLPLSLSHNTSLQSLRMKGLANFNPYNPILDLSWLAPVLNTIESRENFQEFTGVFASSRSYSRDDYEAVIRQWLTGFDWAPVEEAILDLGRFPGEPMVTLWLRGELKHDVVDVVPALKECIPNLAQARRIMIARGHDAADAQPIEWFDSILDESESD